MIGDTAAMAVVTCLWAIGAVEAALLAHSLYRRRQQQQRVLGCLAAWWRP